MEKVIFKDAVLEYFDDLVFALFEEEYFGFVESAEIYKDKIVEYVVSSISTFPYKKTPKSVEYLGLSYIFYKTNSRTTWYVFFEKKDQNYLVTGILNNYNEVVKEL